MKIQSFQQFFAKKYFYQFLLFIILFIAVFFRFYNTPSRYGFDFDPTRDILVSIYGAQHLQFPLTGPESGVGPFTFGPWYYYQLIIAEMLLPFDYAPWIYIGITSVITVFVIYKVGELLEGKRLGLIIALLTALSPAELGPITGLSNPNLIPIHAALSIYLFLLLIKKQPSVWLIFLWGIVMGIGINDHYQMLGLLVLPCIGFLYKRVSITKIVAFLVGMFLTFIPLLIVNFSTNFSTIRGIILYFTHVKNVLYVPNRWLTYLVDFWPGFFSYVIGIPKSFAYILMGFCGIIFADLFKKKKIQSIYVLLFVAFLLNFIVLRYYSGQRENYYLIYLHPFITIFFGWILWNSFQNTYARYIGVIFSIGVLFFVFKEDTRRLQSEKFYLQLQDQTNFLINHFPGKSFQIYHCGTKEKNKSQAIAFFLYTKHKLDDNGLKIGFKSADCRSLFDTYSYLATVDGVVINTLNPKDSEWAIVSPKTVYENTFK